MNLVPAHQNRSQRFLYNQGQKELGGESDIHQPVDVRRAGVRRLGKIAASVAGVTVFMAGAYNYVTTPTPPPEITTPKAEAPPYGKELDGHNRLELYTVEQGEGAYEIAEEHGVPAEYRGAVVRDIQEQLSDGVLNTGDKVVVRVPIEEGTQVSDAQIQDANPNVSGSQEVPQQNDAPGEFGS